MGDEEVRSQIKNQESKIKMQNDKEKLKEEKIPHSVIDQTIRCSNSIGANVVEAKSSHSKKDYIKFFEIALKSANEVKYWLIITKELTRNQENAEKLFKEAIEISNILASSILTLKNKK